MGDLFFLIRMIVMTVVLVVLMQIRIGSGTLEQSTHKWIQSATFTNYLRDVSHGAVKVLHEGYKKIVSSISTNTSKNFDRKNLPGYRSILPTLERSPVVQEAQQRLKEGADRLVREKTETAIEKIEDEVDLDADHAFIE